MDCREMLESGRETDKNSHDLVNNTKNKTYYSKHCQKKLKQQKASKIATSEKIKQLSPQMAGFPEGENDQAKKSTMINVTPFLPLHR